MAQRRQIARRVGKCGIRFNGHYYWSLELFDQINEIVFVAEPEARHPETLDATCGVLVRSTPKSRTYSRDICARQKAIRNFYRSDPKACIDAPSGI